MRDPLASHEHVAVLGLGASGCGAARLLTALGKRVTAVDGGSERDVDLPSGVEIRWGTHDTADATAAVLSPSFNPEWPENRAKPDLAAMQARAARGELEIWSEVVLAACAFEGRLMTIGGTDGKSTTAAMAHALLKAAGVPTLLGGNSWRALSDVVLERPEATHAVVEVSAFQLWEPHGLVPDVSLLTNIAGDHLDHYEGMSDYIAAKLHVHRNQVAGSTAVFFAGDDRLRSPSQRLPERGVCVAGYGLDRPSGPWSGRAWCDDETLYLEDARGTDSIPLRALRVPGLHNRKNAAGAWLAARALVGDDAAVDGETAARGFEAFSGLPHRLQFVRELDGVRYYDDSKATNVHAAATGVASLTGPLVAIVGGVDKKLDLTPLIEALRPSARHVIAIGEVAARFVDEAAPHLRSLERSATLEAAVSAARAAAQPGDAVVLAPGCSSFDMFRSFEDRGRQYAALVQQLTPYA